MLDNSFCEAVSYNIQSKALLAQLEVLSSCPITYYLAEKTNPQLTTASFQIAVESNKVSQEPPFIQAQQPQFTQLLIRVALQTLHQLRCPSLDMLQNLNIFLVMHGSKLDTVFEAWPHQCQVQRDDDCPSLDGHHLSDTDARMPLSITGVRAGHTLKPKTWMGACSHQSSVWETASVVVQILDKPCISDG
ncbi:hypothetical protein BTVI_14832 [Pitangus sulphuratus]|nr:hypothetical protein BTVI_14832 [Pitangus sulphuratus]